MLLIHLLNPDIRSHIKHQPKRVCISTILDQTLYVLPGGVKDGAETQDWHIGLYGMVKSLSGDRTGPRSSNI